MSRGRAPASLHLPPEGEVGAHRAPGGGYCLSTDASSSPPSLPNPPPQGGRETDRLCGAGVAQASSSHRSRSLRSSAGAAWWLARSAPRRSAKSRASRPGGRPQRTAAARLRHARGPLAPAGDTRRRRSALHRDAARLRGQALPHPSRRRSAGAGARGLAMAAQRPHRLRRLDADHAGGAPARAARRTHPRRQAAPDGARDRARAAARARTRSWRSTSRSRPTAAISKACAPPRSPISARSRDADARRSRAAGRAAAVAGAAPARPLCRSGAQGARPRARPHRRGRCNSAGRDRACQARAGAGRPQADAGAGAARRRRGGCGRAGAEACIG